MRIIRYQHYKILTTLLAPLVTCWVRLRAIRGKEESGRIRERFGYSSYGRPQGTLLWIHAASVGEANSVIPLILHLKKEASSIHLLVTTGTVTSALLMKARLPAGIIHQYTPVDTPQATSRFIRHWMPDIAWFVESELWPNLVITAKNHFCLLVMINARISNKSFEMWQRFPNLIRPMLSSFSLCFAQSAADAKRFLELGATNVVESGNLKFDAPPLPCNESDLISLQAVIGKRPVWLAASTHPGEEEMIAETAVKLRKTFPDLLTIIAPRHPKRGDEIQRLLITHGSSVQRSKKELVGMDAGTHFYVADTMGELGLFYRLCDIVFMGGSLVAHGGQNPLEAGHFSCAIIAGPHTYHFAEIYAQMQLSRAVVSVTGTQALSDAVIRLLQDAEDRHKLQTSAKIFVTEHGGASRYILEHFKGILTP